MVGGMNGRWIDQSINGWMGGWRVQEIDREIWDIENNVRSSEE